jgi:hypothetical protein
MGLPPVWLFSRQKEEILISYSHIPEMTGDGGASEGQQSIEATPPDPHPGLGAESGLPICSWLKSRFA